MAKERFSSKFLSQIESACRLKPGKKLRLEQYDPGYEGNLSRSEEDRKREAKSLLKFGPELLAREQEKLYAADSWSLLVIFQAMDAAGKDGTIKHVMSGVNPQGCQVYSFKQPSAEDLDHNFLWRHMRALPERGRIGIFNRSYYEDVLVVRVHPDILEHQRIPNLKVGDNLWRERYEDINAFEKHLSRNGTRIVKFFLNVSREEQSKRFLDRIEEGDKNWKFGANDLTERDYWKDYMKAYEEAISATNTEWAPWYIVPADHKWITRAAVASILTHCIKSLKAEYPEATKEQRETIAAAKKALKKEKKN